MAAIIDSLNKICNSLFLLEHYTKITPDKNFKNHKDILLEQIKILNDKYKKKSEITNILENMESFVNYIQNKYHEENKEYFGELRESLDKLYKYLQTDLSVLKKGSECKKNGKSTATQDLSFGGNIRFCF